MIKLQCSIPDNSEKDNFKKFTIHIYYIYTTLLIPHTRLEYRTLVTVGSR
jgi:hypothetical protein